MRYMTLLSLCLAAFPALANAEALPTLRCSTQSGMDETTTWFVLKNGAIYGSRSDTHFGPLKCQVSAHRTVCSGFTNLFDSKGPILRDLISISIQKFSDVVNLDVPKDGRIDFVSRSGAVKPLQYLASFNIVDVELKEVRAALPLVCTEGEGI